MSLKRQIQFRYRALLQSLQTVHWPRWLVSPLARFILLFIIVSFSAAYIINITSSATGGYKLHELEKQTRLLETEVQKLQIEIADNSSLNNIQTRLSKLEMVEAASVKYLVSKNTVVAKN